MTIDDFIADKIRKRFNLPADSEVWFDIEPGMDYTHTSAFSFPDVEVTIIVGNYFEPYPNSAGRKPSDLAEYECWDDFVADMEVSNDV